MESTEMTQAVQEAQAILAEAGKFYSWETGYRSPRALHGRKFGSRPDLNFWAARITGRDTRYGFAREFLGKVWPISYDKKATPARDFTGVQAGDLIEVEVADSWKHTRRVIYRVVDVDDTGIRLVPATDRDLAKLS